MPQSLNGSATSTAAARLWQPVLFRSMITLFFGIVTVFWGSPSAVGLCLAVAPYFLVLAAAQFWFVRRSGLQGTHRLALLASAAFLAVAGVVIFISVNTYVAGWLGAAALVIFGATELFAALKATGKSQLRSDWLISGALAAGTGLLLPFFIAAGPHAMLGVSGGGALMTGALWLLSALTMRHDARKAKRVVN